MLFHVTYIVLLWLLQIGVAVRVCCSYFDRSSASVKCGNSNLQYCISRRVYTAVYLSKANTFQKLTGKNGHVDTLVGYNFQKEKSLPASFKPQEILWLMLH